jgi:exonuclease V gamma subunit
MISERQALMMIEDEMAQQEFIRLQRKHLCEVMQAYASRISQLGEEGHLKKFEIQLEVADRLYNEGTAEVRELMEKVYMSTLSHALERKPELLAIAKKHLSRFLLKVMHTNQLPDNP